jgi:phosphopantetheinyl transferase
MTFKISDGSLFHQDCHNEPSFSPMLLDSLVQVSPLPPLPPLSGLSGRDSCMTTISLEELGNLLRQSKSILALNQWLSSAEQKILNRFFLPKRRVEWIGGRLAAKIAIHRLASHGDSLFPPDQLSILPDESGRPKLEGIMTDGRQRTIFFSISHSGNQASAIAVGGFFCGLDIQQVSPALSSIKEKFCCHGERKILQQTSQLALLNKNEQLALLWCAKESFRKTLTLTPLPGFREATLKSAPVSIKNAFHLPMRFVRKNLKIDYTSVAWLQSGMAASITILSPSTGAQYG